MGINPGAVYGLWAGQTAALFKISPDQSGRTALPSITSTYPLQI